MPGAVRHRRIVESRRAAGTPVGDRRRARRRAAALTAMAVHGRRGVPRRRRAAEHHGALAKPRPAGHADARFALGIARVRGDRARTPAGHRRGGAHGGGARSQSSRQGLGALRAGPHGGPDASGRFPLAASVASISEQVMSRPSSRELVIKNYLSRDALPIATLLALAAGYAD